MGAPPLPPSPEPPGLLARLLAWRPFRKPEPELYERALFVHLVNAQPGSALR